MLNQAISFTLNGKPVQLDVDGERMLLWILRTELGLTGAKHGCGIGLCGSCTVLVGGQAVRSCQFPVKNAAGKRVLTIEGLAAPGAPTLHPLQEAFIKHDALQCGFCTPGMILNAYGLFLKKPRPTEKDILAAMEGNLCRCGSHQRILRAIREVAGGGTTRRGKESPGP